MSHFCYVYDIKSFKYLKHFFFQIFVKGNSHNPSNWQNRLVILKRDNEGPLTLASYSSRMYLEFAAADYYTNPESLGFYVTITVWDKDTNSSRGKVDRQEKLFYIS